MSHQSRFDARCWMLGAGALGRPRGMVWGGKREEDSGWGTRVYLWQIHVDIWQNQYNIVKLKIYIYIKKKKRALYFSSTINHLQGLPTAPLIEPEFLLCCFYMLPYCLIH